ncbi:MAG: 5'-nucleotidase C-terminal domain-containing protein [Betaproteobacteria bacterium]|nr:5'-nucleotidase C-terminal domain-containing protein [Betaproteobacteria bacterium]
MSRTTRLLAALLLGLAFAAPGAWARDEGAYPPLELNIAHINDHHSNLAPFAEFDLTVGGVPTRVEAGGMARTAARLRALDGTPNLLKLHAGDAITGTLFHTLFKGEADAALMKTLCFDAMSLGNHEFDDGDAGLRRFLDFMRQGGCYTPVLAANVEPEVGTPLAPLHRGDYLQPYLVKWIGGAPVGIIGIVVRGKTRDSSRPLPTTRFLDEAETAQRQIDALKAQGVRHIVLLTHHGYQADLALAAKLSDVDVIIGGDSHTLLGDFAAYGLAAAGPYPTRATNRDGDPVCVGQAWEYNKVVGHMNVRFDSRGRVADCVGQATLQIGDRFSRADAAGSFAPVDEATRQDILAALAAQPAVQVVTPEPMAEAEIERYAGLMEKLTRRVIGSAAEPLCLVRIPGEAAGRGGGVAGCEGAYRLARGGDIVQVVAEAFLAASRRADFALQNAGGVRISLPAGPISFESANKVLPFANVLVEMPVTGAQLVAALEDAVANHLDQGGSSGGHPYMAGARWDLDLSRPRGQRFSNVQVRDRQTGVWSAIDPARAYTLVTNDFLASGKEGYATLGAIHATGNYVNTYLPYTQTFVDYVQGKGAVTRPATADYSHQRVITREGKAL